jgi:hypothetical protein
VGVDRSPTGANALSFDPNLPFLPEKQPEQHHNIYVVLLDPAVGRIRYEDVVYDNQEF